MLAPDHSIAFRKTLRWSLSLAVVLFLLCGGLAIQPFAYSAPQTTDAWLEAKPALVFPLTSPKPPDSQDAFLAALIGGLQHLAVTPAGATVLSSEPAAYPTLHSIRIDLSNAIEDDTHKPPHVNWHFVPQPGVHVDRLQVTARPLIIQGATVQYDLTADGADLQMAEDRAKHPLLMLMGATAGHFSVTAAHADVETLCLAAAKQFAHKYGFAVKSLKLELTTPTPRTLDAKLTVSLDGGMGGKLHFTGRFTINDNLNATATNLSCHGDGPGGVLISTMLGSGMMFYNGKTKPLVSFPFNGLALRDVKLRADDDLHIDADFGLNLNKPRPQR
jgi:hypothetical protein